MSERHKKASPCGAIRPKPTLQEVQSSATAPELAALILAVAAGDRGALRILYDSTGGRLFGLAVRLLDGRDSAEAVLQETYVRVWMQAAKYDPDREAPMPWLWRILSDVANEQLRRDRRGQARVRDLTLRLQRPGRGQTGLDRVPA